MARSYAKVLLAIWEEEGDFRQLPAGAQRLYIVMLSHAALSPCGLLPLQLRRWARLAPDTTAADMRVALDHLTASNKVLVDEDTEEVFIRTFIRHDGGYRTPNIHRGIQSAIQRIESHPLRRAAWLELSRLDESLQVTSLDETLDPTVDETDTERDRPKTVSRQPESGIQKPSAVSPDERPSNVFDLPQQAPDDDDDFGDTVLIIVAAKEADTQPHSPRPWRRKVTASTRSEDGPGIRRLLEGGASPIKAASAVLGSRVAAEVAAKQIGYVPRTATG